MLVRVAESRRRPASFIQSRPWLLLFNARALGDHFGIHGEWPQQLNINLRILISGSLAALPEEAELLTLQHWA